MLGKLLEIMNDADALFAEKPDGTKVKYYIFPEFEIHINSIPSSTIQGWHSHTNIEEILLVTNGAITVESIIQGHIKSNTCQKDEMVRMKQSIHRVMNLCKAEANFVVFQFVPEGRDNRELMKNDKVEYSDEEIELILR